MITRSVLASLLVMYAITVTADPADPCAGLTGSALDQCRADLQARQDEKLENLQERLQQQQARQQQLDEQQRQMQAQMQQMRLDNDALRKQLASPKAADPPAKPAATANSKVVAMKHAGLSGAEFKQWKSENPWYGSDYEKTAFATRYSKELERERPELVGRPLLDAIAAKVNETFGAPK